MTSVAAEAVFVAVLIFCRVGTFLMLVPGFASARIAPRIRLAIAAALSVSLYPVLDPVIRNAISGMPESVAYTMIVGETARGFTIGLLCRVFIAALQFGATVAANCIGLMGIPGTPMEDTEASSPVATLASLSATALLFMTNQHIEAIRAMVDSYTALPPQVAVDLGWMTSRLAERLSETFALAVRLAGPFIIYAVIVNLAIGFANRLVPQISIYFVSLGLITLGGILLLHLAADDWLTIFVDGYTSWLATG